MGSSYADRVKETTATTGTGTVTLAGAVSGFQAFSSAFAAPNTSRVRYCLLSGNGTDWEVGDGTYTVSSTTLSRDNIYASSNSNAAINLTGTTTVFCDMPAQSIADIGLTAAFAMRRVNF